jgi:DinB superfamily
MSVAALRAEFEAAKKDARDLLAGIGDPAFNWRHAPGTWSMAQCLDHLNLTGRKYLRALDRAIEEGRAKNLVGRGPFRYGLLESWAVRTMDAPPMFRIKAPRAFLPASEGKIAESLAAFLALQDEFQQRLARADGLDLRRVKARSPVSRHLKFSLGKAFAGISAHQRRHLWQARKLKDDAAFPAS